MKIFSIFALINCLGALFISMLVFTENKHSVSNKLFILFGLAISVWSFGYWRWLMVGSGYPGTAFFWIKAFTLGSMLIPGFYFHWVLHLIQPWKWQRVSTFFLYAISVIFIATTIISPSLFIKSVSAYEPLLYWPQAGVLYGVYISIYFTAVILSLILLVKNYRMTDDKEKRKQYFYVILGTIIGFGGGATNFFLWYGIPFLPYGNVLVFIGLLFWGYAATKYNLFNFKVIAAELLTFAIWIAVLTQAIMVDTFNGRLLGGGTLLFAVVLGIFLIKSVKKEVAQREQIEELAGRLKSVNRIMSHDIKNVLGKNKDMYGMLLDGTFGAIPDTAKPFLERLLCDTKQLVRSVISILESGQEFTLKLAPFDIKIPVLEIIKDVSHDAEEKGLTIKTNIDESQDYTILGDEAQLSTRVFRNLIENAVNYTLAGSVTIGLSKKADSIIFSVADTGVGITEEDKKNLFQEGGHGKDSLKVNVHSTGYGLFSAKKVVDAHGGKIWFETVAGKGTTFFVEMKRVKSE